MSEAQDDNRTQLQHAAPTHLFQSDALPAVPGFQLLAEVGRGGMGVVYRARDKSLNRDVAVKLLQNCFPPDGSAAQRFVEESRITSQLQHPGIPPIHQVGALADGRPFLVMKLIKGRTLDRLLKERPTPNADRGRFLAVFEQICQTVGYAHAHNVIHRDLKPANIMVGAFGEVQVMDWGLSKSLTDTRPADTGAPTEETPRTAIGSLRDSGSATQAGSVMGTPAFMPPEQAGGEIAKIDCRSDVFSLGAVLCVILTGEGPYAADTADAVHLMAVRGQLNDALTRLDASDAEPELAALCMRCLSVERDGRPKDANELAAAVAGFRSAAEERARQAELDRVRAEGERAKAEAEAREQRKRRKVQLALAAAVGLLLAAGGGFAWWQDHQTTAARIEENRRKSLTEQEVTSALAEMATLCDRGDREIENPPRWRLTLTAARAAHRRAAAAVETGPASDEIQEKVRVAAFRLEQDEADCDTAEACEKCLVAFLGALPNKSPDRSVPSRQLEAVFERGGVPLRGAPEGVAAALRAHRLRYQLTALLLTGVEISPDFEPLTPLLTPQLLGAVTREIHPLIPTLMERAKRPHRVGEKVNIIIDREAMVAQFHDGAGRELSSTELVCLSFYKFKQQGWYNDELRRYGLVEIAHQRNPSNLFALVWRTIEALEQGGRTIPGDVGTGEKVEYVQPLLPSGPEFPLFDKKLDERNVRAKGVLTAATGARPDVVLFWLLCGNNFAEDGYFQTAAEYYREAVRLDPTSVWAHLALAEALLNSDQRLPALDAYRMLLQRFGPLDDYQTLTQKFAHVPANTTADVRIRTAQAAIRRACVEVDKLAVAKLDRVGPTTLEKQELRREALRWLREWLKGSKPTARDLFVVEHDPAFSFVFEPDNRPELSSEEARRWDYLLDDIRATRGSGGQKYKYFFNANPVPRLPVQVAPAPREVKR